MEKYNMVLLNKNKDVKIINKESDIKKYKPEHILIPMIEYDTNTFIMIIPKKKLLNFTNIEIEVKLQLKSNVNVINDEDDVDYETNELFTLKKSFTNIVGFINFIHSIDRIDYANYVLNSEYFYEYELIDIKSIYINVSNNNEIVYEYKFISSYESGYGNKSNCYTVTLELEELYEPSNKVFREKFINIKNNKWSIDEKPYMDSIIGINLLPSQSVYFIEYDIFQLFKNKEIQYNLYVFNKSDVYSPYNHLDIDRLIEEDVMEIYLNKSLIQKDIFLIIEFLIYIKLLYSIVIMLYNNILYTFDPNKNEGFDMYLNIKLMDRFNSKEVKINMLKDNILSFDRVIEKIYKRLE